MTTIRRTHYLIPRRSCDDGAIKVSTDAEIISHPNYMMDILIKAVCRLYEQEEGEEYNGTTGEVA